MPSVSPAAFADTTRCFDQWIAFRQRSATTVLIPGTSFVAHLRENVLRAGTGGSRARLTSHGLRHTAATHMVRKPVASANYGLSPMCWVTGRRCS